MRPVWIAPALGGAALVVLLALAGNNLKETTEPATASIGGPAPQDGLAVPAAGTMRSAPLKARPVNPALVAPPQIDASELERIEPRAPLGDIALALPPKPGVPEKTLLHRPVATAAGLIEAQGHSIALGDIVAVDPDEVCTAADGSSWPCGMAARTAFRNWLRGRAVACTVAEPPAPETVITACNLGGDDIALWLVENGLATARPGGPYIEAGDKARAEGRGIFGPGPAIVR